MVIPHFPTLNVFNFFKKSQPVDRLPFPLNNQRSVFYYLARNAVNAAIEVLNLRAGDEILMPAYNSGVEYQPFVKKGIVIKYYDLAKDLSVPLESLRTLISNKTKALYLIHMWGFVAANFQEVLEFSKFHNLYLIEDCALSFLSSYHNKYLGSFGDVSIFSLRKSLPIPNGGVLVVNNEKLALPRRPEPPKSFYSTLIELGSLIMENWSLRFSFWVPVRDLLRWLFRRILQPRLQKIGVEKVSAGILAFDEAKANWGMSQISEFVIRRLNYSEIISRRRQNYEHLVQMINKAMPDIKLLLAPLVEGTVPLFLPVLVKNNHQVVTHLQQAGIGAGLWWQDFPFLKEENSYPTLVYLKKHLVEIPIYQDLEEKEILFIFRTIQEWHTATITS